VTLKDLIKLAGQEGKVIIIDDDGRVKGVFLSEVAYRQMGGSEKPPVEAVDREKINREILEAQLRENVDLGKGNLETISGPIQMPKPIGQILQERVQNLFVSHPASFHTPDIDYNQPGEVVDPNYGHRAAPRVSIDEEEIKPNFDDI
jgi:hypothetical protein